jgi:hypothetical protein
MSRILTTWFHPYAGYRPKVYVGPMLLLPGPLGGRKSGRCRKPALPSGDLYIPGNGQAAISSSMGDAVTIFSRDVALSDVWVTAVCNEIRPNDRGVPDRVNPDEVDRIFAIMGDVTVRWGGTCTHGFRLLVMSSRSAPRTGEIKKIYGFCPSLDKKAEICRYYPGFL